MSPFNIRKAISKALASVENLNEHKDDKPFVLPTIPFAPVATLTKDVPSIPQALPMNDGWLNMTPASTDSIPVVAAVSISVAEEAPKDFLLKHDTRNPTSDERTDEFGTIPTMPVEDEPPKPRSQQNLFSDPLLVLSRGLPGSFPSLEGQQVQVEKAGEEALSHEPSLASAIPSLPETKASFVALSSRYRSSYFNQFIDIQQKNLQKDSPSTTVPSSSSVPSQDSQHLDSPIEDEPKPPKRRKQPGGSAFPFMRPIGESSASDISTSLSSTPGLGDETKRKMEELGRLRRLESQQSLVGHAKASSEGTPPIIQAPPILRSPPASPIKKVPEIFIPSKMRQDIKSSELDTLLKDAHLERQKDLQTQLDRALGDFKRTQLENVRLNAESVKQERALKALRTELIDATRTASELRKEKNGWQEQLDTMQHKLSQAERQIRSLDNLTRLKLEARQEVAYGPAKKIAKFLSTAPSSDIIGAVNALNEEIFQSALLLVENLERTTTFVPSSTAQVKRDLGDRLTAMLEAQAAKKTTAFGLLLMQVVLEVFFVQWCSAIIEANYPKQDSFADLLIELSAKSSITTHVGTGVFCGRHTQVIQTHSTPAATNVKFSEWSKDIVKDLSLVLMVGGLRMRPNRADLFNSKILALVKAAYDLRTGMAERDICGGLELCVIAPDTPFSTMRMQDSHADPRKPAATGYQMDCIVGTSALGLHKKVTEKAVDGSFQTKFDVVLKPKVVLARVLTG
ncbi:hypothetical protein B0H34DRAFT_857099 [Crassisporium funariophilum]|nr:hypothetical protein B0H34DRAFT_857099 [Crassisporium funariophilum]